MFLYKVNIMWDDEERHVCGITYGSNYTNAVEKIEDFYQEELIAIEFVMELEWDKVLEIPKYMFETLKTEDVNCTFKE